ncbi:hypothetical protein LF1_26860 [Rubripirellula obstinata]|uniref:Putative restriction endonuclease domain-containing protein n=1 Tax=Rubripirellula obstinata TaxID=406547 RepID=A0A5B1CG27_9BACT|nr:Uma2 family endonuclease [Rubripirellula obstinata]KAA1260147.1 hypothetical protein LF1_26860 [Rubripirellula obstinata]
MVSVMVNDPDFASQLIADRQARQIDRYDEVWEGVYMMSPLANNEHQSLATELSIAIGSVVDWQDLGRTLAGANVSDRADDWTKNYRIPDVLVFKPDTAAEDRGSHWFGGPELAIEIVSPGDKTLEKLDFYAEVGTRELLVIDRDPWKLTLYRTSPNKKLTPEVVCTLHQHVPIVFQEFPITLSLEKSTTSLNVSRSGGDLIRAIPLKRDQ